MQGNVFCIYSKSTKHIIDIRGMSDFECPGNSLDFIYLSANLLLKI